MTMTKEEAFQRRRQVALHRAQGALGTGASGHQGPALRTHGARSGPHSDKADCSRALRDLHAWAGAPSPREMEAAAGRHGELPTPLPTASSTGKSCP